MEATLLVSTEAPPALAEALAQRLGEAVAVCRAETLVAALRSAVGRGARRIAVLPCASPLRDDAAAVEATVRLCSQRWPYLAFHLAPPLTATEWAEVLRRVAADALRDGAPGQAAVLIAARMVGDLARDGELAGVAWRVARLGGFGHAAAAFVDDGGLERELERAAAMGLRETVVVPWLCEAASTPGGVQAVSPYGHASLLYLLAERHVAALQDDTLTRPAWDAVAARVAVAPEDEAAGLRELDRKINALLPPAYQGRYEQVAPTSMGTAPLQYADDGSVAWDRMWTSFCDLALAGGPAHRGKLLEAVTAEEARSDPAAYENVVAEIERGIRQVTALPLVRSEVPGWVGVRCDSEEMAVWLVRAIIVENVMVRREGEVLYVPAGPRFALHKEIKNVVTVVAKTCHYWSAHRAVTLTGQVTGPLSPAVDG
jgi:sirohydrochlorin cobaltochelatase